MGTCFLMASRRAAPSSFGSSGLVPALLSPSAPSCSEAGEGGREVGAVSRRQRRRAEKVSSVDSRLSPCAGRGWGFCQAVQWGLLRGRIAAGRPRLLSFVPSAAARGGRPKHDPGVAAPECDTCANSPGLKLQSYSPLNAARCSPPYRLAPTYAKLCIHSLSR
jgi:hypothetical protein